MSELGTQPQMKEPLGDHTLHYFVLQFELKYHICILTAATP